jgi:NTP-dependent ternary system trypsin peptidase co-occuring protein
MNQKPYKFLYILVIYFKMTKLLELTSSNDDSSSFLIESTEIEDYDSVQQASGHIEKEFDKLLERVKPFCESILNNFQSLSHKPSSASAEFGLNVTAEGNVFVVKASGQATLKITLNWNNLK